MASGVDVTPGTELETASVILDYKADVAACTL